jgi:hypothetical protein
MNLLDLSESLFFIIHTFIASRPRTFAQNPDDGLDQYVDLGGEVYSRNWNERVLEDKNWRDFLNTTIKFQQLKRKTLFLYFGDKSSMEYFSSRIFRSFILHEMVTNASEQLGFQLTKALPPQSLCKHFTNLHYLSLRHVRNDIPVEILKDIKILELKHCSFAEEVSFTINAEVLSLDEMVSSINFHELRLPNVSKLFLRRDEIFRLNDLSNYPQLKLLTVENCYFDDEEIQINCQHMEIVSFSNFFNDLPVADLSKTKKIHLSGDSIPISENWANVEILEIKTRDVITIPAFQKLSVLRLQAPNITTELFTTATLPSLRELVLADCYRIKTIVLAGDHLIKFCVAEILKDSSKLPFKLESIDARDCPSLKEFYMLDLGIVMPVKCLISYIVPKITVEKTSIDFCNGSKVFFSLKC